MGGDHMIFVGVDWAEAHHDICVLDAQGAILARKRILDTLTGVRELHELLGQHTEEPEEVFIGIEKDRGLIVTSMLGAGYRVYALNPLSVSRYRERHVTSGSKSDPGDAKVLADRGLRARRVDQDPGAHAPGRDLVASARGQRTAQRAEGLLPGCAAGLRDRSHQP
jgi:hypothetical protein